MLILVNFEQLNSFLNLKKKIIVSDSYEYILKTKNFKKM